MSATYPCPSCRSALAWVAQHGQWYCAAEQRYFPPVAAAVPSPSAAPAGVPAPWAQNAYRIRKKVLALANQYRIESPDGHLLGYSRQKMFRIREDIRIFTDESMTTEQFRIRQTNWTDAWGTFAILDTASNQALGSLRRKALMSGFVRDEWELYDAHNRLVGEVREATGRGLARKFVPGGGLIPEQVTVSLGGQPVATIHQQFKIVGDIWDIQCLAVPAHFDRRVLLACALLMGMIERSRK